jgi:hypothetical protein
MLCCTMARKAFSRSLSPIASGGSGCNGVSFCPRDLGFRY